MLPTIQVKILDQRLKGMMPSYATAGSAGMDVRAAIDKPLELAPGEVRLVPTGLAIHIANAGYCGMLLPRSGTGHKRGIVLGNLVGLLDSDYQGQLMISAWNRTSKPAIIEPFERVAQLVVVPVATPAIEVVEEFHASARGVGGFGSTGT